LIVGAVFLSCCFMLVTVVVVLIMPPQGQSAETPEIGGKAVLFGFSLLLAAIAFWSGRWLFLGEEGVAQAKNQDVAEEYFGAWRSDAPTNLVQTLISNNVRGCGEFHYKPSSQNSGEYLVYCTPDGHTWTAYLVWPNVHRISGPAEPESSIVPPRK
ncbi:hypothetical protein ACOI1H_26245, partial [Loktanella sp. DJP18]|uniref:hypothetical protein n=1 Tax=Loktanella sp. DJP18 TaxID=3409788 RepID=UPI003BB6088C